jgi:hypothetical protein
MTRFLASLAAALLLSTAAAAGTTTSTGPNGEIITSTRSCARADGARTCLRETTILATSGAEATRERLTVITRDTVTSTLSGTRFNGSTFSRTTVTSR